MKLAIDIVQSLLFPKLEKDANFDANLTNIAFWETFTTAFLDFEKDAKPVYAAIYSLELHDPEKVISKLDSLYIAVIKELAEKYVLGDSNAAIDYLINSKNTVFEKEVAFLTDLQNVIKKVERKRIKQEIPKGHERLSFNLSDDNIALAIKKQEREVLKRKMKIWDKETVNTDEIPVFSLNAKISKSESDKKEKTKVISLYWVKYAIAASLILAIGIQIYYYQNQGMVPQNSLVTTPQHKATPSKTDIVPELPNEDLADITIVSKSMVVVENSGLGYSSKTNKISIVQKQQKSRIISINKAIEKYQLLLEKEFISNKGDESVTVKKVKEKINALNEELNDLREKQKQYVFDGKILTITVYKNINDNKVLLYEEGYYLKKEKDFYKLSNTKKPQPYIKEKDSAIIEALDKMLFDNGY